MKNKKPNQLINEKSPYLLQHAYNLVDWYPWSDEAFQKAKNELKPIFLSIGYSTCHWCHVMEHESFVDEEVAFILNNNFVSIKLDREERPDLDQIYMTACQVLTGAGGWPLTIFMTPEKKPFFAGTYFPKVSKFNKIGFIDLINRILDVWNKDYFQVIESANEITKSLNKNVTYIIQNSIDFNVIEVAVSKLQSTYDEYYGGFGSRPKFPMGHNLSFLLDYYYFKNDDSVLKMVEKTLIELRKGGIYDQIGYGFHRYSTDERWLVPHFEKMLYDNALLIIAYSKAYSITKNEFYKDTVNEIIEYIARDLTNPQGAFYSAEDADSDGEEGKFYVWTEIEIDEILGKDSEFFKKIFNVNTDGNFVHEIHASSDGTNIPHLVKSYSELATDFEIEESDLLKRIGTLKQKLFEIREKRIRPFKDDKVLTDWNGLMISALALSSKYLKNNNNLIFAINAAEFIIDNLYKGNKLLHRYRDGESKFDANLDDYSYLCYGLIMLFKSTFNPKYLRIVFELQETMNKEFEDKVNGGYYNTKVENIDTIARIKELFDGAMPSGNSIQMMNLVELFNITSDITFRDKVDFHFKATLSTINKYPSGATFYLSALLKFQNPTKSLIIITENNQFKIPDDEIEVVVLNNENKSKLIELIPYLQNFTLLNGKTTYYYCENFKCNLPVNEI
ncbi:MAG: thioredoxin domain-containing protein [Candidatus Kapabacteria bacterium]|nr:thioredoxin domain-containing protein [Candidatus Kapabacteria bacterium]